MKLVPRSPGEPGREEASPHTARRTAPRAGFIASAAVALALAGAACGGTAFAQSGQTSQSGHAPQSGQARPVVEAGSWARATIGASPVGAAYLTIRNASSADRLLSVSTPAAARVELHEHRLDGEIARMRQLQALDVPAGATIAMKPGGLHVMLLDLKAPLVAGESLPLTLRFERAGEVRATVPVRASAPSGKHGAHGDHGTSEGGRHGNGTEDRGGTHGGHRH